MILFPQDYVEAEQSRLDKLRLVLDNLNGTVSGQHFMTEENHTAASAHSVVTRLSELTSQLGNDLMNSRVSTHTRSAVYLNDASRLWLAQSSSIRVNFLATFLLTECAPLYAHRRTA